MIAVWLLGTYLLIAFAIFAYHVHATRSKELSMSLVWSSLWPVWIMIFFVGAIDGLIEAFDRKLGGDE